MIAHEAATSTVVASSGEPPEAVASWGERAHAARTFPAGVLVLSLLVIAGSYAPWAWVASGYSSTSGPFTITDSGLFDWGAGNVTVVLGALVAAACVSAMLRPGLAAALAAASLLGATSVVSINELLGDGVTSSGWSWYATQLVLQWGLVLVIAASVVGTALAVAWAIAEHKARRRAASGAQEGLADQASSARMLAVSLLVLSALVITGSFMAWVSGWPGLPVARMVSIAGVSSWGSAGVSMVVLACGVAVCCLFGALGRGRSASVVALSLTLAGAAVCALYMLRYENPGFSEERPLLHVDSSLMLVIVVATVCIAVATAWVAVERRSSAQPLWGPPDE